MSVARPPSLRDTTLRSEVDPPEGSTGLAAVSMRTSAVEVIVLRSLALPFALLTIGVTSRALHPEGQGRFVLAVLLPTVLATLLSLGVSAAHAIGRGDDPSDVSRRLLVTASWSGTAAALVCGGAAAALWPGLWVAALALPAMVICQAFGGLLLAVGRVRPWGVVQLAVQAFPCAAIVLFVVVLQRGVVAALLGWALGQALTALLCLLAVRDLLLAPSLAGARPRTRLLSLALRAGGANVASLLNYRLDLLIVAALTTTATVGVYSVSVQFAELLWLLSSAIATVAVRRVLVADEPRAVQLVCQASRQAVVVTATAALVAGLLVIVALPTILGSAYAAARLPFLALLPGVIIFSPASCLAVYFSMRHGKTLAPLATVLVSAMVTAAVAFPLVRMGGAVGAALASDAGYAAGILTLIILFVRAVHVPTRQLVPGTDDILALTSMPAAVRRPPPAATAVR